MIGILSTDFPWSIRALVLPINSKYLLLSFARTGSVGHKICVNFNSLLSQGQKFNIHVNNPNYTISPEMEKLVPEWNFHFKFLDFTYQNKYKSTMYL